MTVPLAFVTWRGLKRHMEVQCTVTHGIEPSRITISIPPDPEISLGGTLTIQQGNVVINFRDCRADTVDVYKDGDGLEMWTVTILDRRWKWKLGQISGFYNVRVEKTIRKGTEKNIKDLMKLCLEAMGEKNFDLSAVPKDIFPEVEWNYVLPAEALSQLADMIGYRVVFQVVRDRVAILKEGVGRKLKQENATDYSATYDPPEIPTELRFVGDRVIWELDLALEAVAEDTDHTVKLLNDPSLSYHPTGFGIPRYLEGVYSYWSEYDDQIGNVVGNQKISLVTGETSLKDFAKANIYRKYRVTPEVVRYSVRGASSKQLFLPHPAGTIKVERLEQLLPLLRERLATYKTELGDRQKPAVVWGQFDHGNSSFRNNIEKKPIASSSGAVAGFLADGSPPKNQICTDGWSLDAERGIVTFDKPMLRRSYQRVTKVRRDGRQYSVITALSLPAIIWLRTSFGCRDNDTLAWKSWEIIRKLDASAKTKPKYVRHTDIPLSMCVGAGGKVFPIKDASEKDYKKAAKFYLDEAEKKYEIRDPVAVTYPYIRYEELDGAVQQISWQITSNGAFTKISRNREEPLLGYSYGEQRMFQQVQARLKDGASTSREQADKLAQRPGKA